MATDPVITVKLPLSVAARWLLSVPGMRAGDGTLGRYIYPASGANISDPVVLAVLQAHHAFVEQRAAARSGAAYKAAATRRRRK